MKKQSLGLRQFPIYQNDQFRNYYDVGDIDEKDYGEDNPIQETPNLTAPNTGLTAQSYQASDQTIIFRQMDKSFKLGERHWSPTYGDFKVMGLIGPEKRIIMDANGKRHIVNTNVLEEERIVANVVNKTSELSEFVNNNYSRGYNWRGSDPLTKRRRNWMGGEYQPHNFSEPINEEDDNDGYSDANPRNYPKNLKNNPQEPENKINYQVNKYPSSLNLHGY